MSLENPILDYSYLESPDGTLHTQPQRTDPLTITMDSRAWEQLENRFQGTGFEESGYNLMAGSINLINLIEEKHEAGQPLETLLFLDRSGRLAAYTLRNAYEQLALVYGMRGQELATHFPKVRFMNIGSEDYAKHSDTIACAQLSRLYRADDFKENATLIVDEYIYTGASVRNAGRVVRDAGFAKETPAITMFHNCPDWYGDNWVKGVADVGTINMPTRNAFEVIAKRAPDIIDHATEIVRRHGWRNIIEVIQKGPFYSTGAIPSKDINFIKNLCDESHIDHVVRYLASSGGFISLSPTQEMSARSRRYREKLKELIRESLQNNLITFV